jgi:hypothetical protein
LLREGATVFHDCARPAAASIFLNKADWRSMLSISDGSLTGLTAVSIWRPAIYIPYESLDREAINVRNCSAAFAFCDQRVALRC